MLLVGPRLMQRDHAVKESFRVCSVGTAGNQSDSLSRVALRVARRRDLHILADSSADADDPAAAGDAFGFLCGDLPLSSFVFLAFFPGFLPARE